MSDISLQLIIFSAMIIQVKKIERKSTRIERDQQKEREREQKMAILLDICLMFTAHYLVSAGIMGFKKDKEKNTVKEREIQRQRERERE